MTRADPILIHLYSEVLQRFRLAAQGKGAGRSRRSTCAKRVETYFDPLPFYYAPLESAGSPTRRRYPLNAVTQRPMAMYHSWDSQNAWLRQIHSHNYLFVNPRHRRGRTASPTATGSGSSRHGARCAACAALRGGRARHGVDLERDRQGRRRLALAPTPTSRARASCSTT
jgi:hypothetical protein